MNKLELDKFFNGDYIDHWKCEKCFSYVNPKLNDCSECGTENTYKRHPDFYRNHCNIDAINNIIKINIEPCHYYSTWKGDGYSSFLSDDEKLIGCDYQYLEEPELDFDSFERRKEFMMNIVKQYKGGDFYNEFKMLADKVTQIWITTNIPTTFPPWDEDL